MAQIGPNAAIRLTVVDHANTAGGPVRCRMQKSGGADLGPQVYALVDRVGGSLRSTRATAGCNERLCASSSPLAWLGLGTAVGR